MRKQIQTSIIALASLLTIAAVTGCGNSSGGGAPAKQVFRVEGQPSHDIDVRKVSIYGQVTIDDTVPNGQADCTAILGTGGGGDSHNVLISGGDQLLCNGVPFGDNIVDETANTQIVMGMKVRVPVSSDGRYTITFVRDGLAYTGTVQMATTVIGDARISPASPGHADDINVEWSTQLNRFDQHAGISKQVQAVTQRKTEHGLSYNVSTSSSRGTDSVQIFRAKDTEAKSWPDTVSIELILSSYGTIQGMPHGMLTATKKHTIAVQIAR